MGGDHVLGAPVVEFEMVEAVTQHLPETHRGGCVQHPPRPYRPPEIYHYVYILELWLELG